MDQAITRATPRAVGEFEGYVDGEPSVRWTDRKNMPNVGDKLFLDPARAAGIEPRMWSILLTSANHGAVGPFGSQFPHAGERHERVKVVEIIETGAPPARDADLAGLVRLPLTNEQIDDAWDSIPATFTRGQGEQEWDRENRRAFARAIEREVAAQAGQVAVPEGWAFAPLKPTKEMLAAAMLTWANTPGAAIEETYAAMLAAAPSAPAVAQQAPAQAVPGWISVDERLPDAGYCLATYRNQHGKLRIIRAKYARQFEIDAGEDAIDHGNCEYNEADDTYYLKAGWLECIDNWGEYSSVYVCEGEVTHWMPLPALPGAQASTAGERQEGGAA